MTPTPDGRHERQLLFGAVCPLVTYALVAGVWSVVPTAGMGLAGVVVGGSALLFVLTDPDRDVPETRHGQAVTVDDLQRETKPAPRGPVMDYATGVLVVGVLAVPVVMFVL